MVTWEHLTGNEQYELKCLVAGEGAIVCAADLKMVCRKLEFMGLVTAFVNKDGDLDVTPTDAGRALVPTASAGGGAGDDLAYHIKCAVVAALSEDKWRNDWTSEEAVNQLTFEIAALRQQVAGLRAALDFYADDDNWTVKSPKFGEAYSLVDKDMGEQARKALGEADNGS